MTKFKLKLRNAHAYFKSTFAVASSNTKILFPRKIARAKDISCRCPTLKLLPPSYTFVKRPPGRSLISSFNST